MMSLMCAPFPSVRSPEIVEIVGRRNCFSRVVNEAKKQLRTEEVHRKRRDHVERALEVVRPSGRGRARWARSGCSMRPPVGR